jgi:hypothetical protein
MDDAPYTVTLKAGSGYDAPWIIVKADTADRLVARLNELQNKDADRVVTRVSDSLQTSYKYQQEMR